MKILFIGANGIDTSRLRLGAELRDIQAEIQRAQARGEIEVRAELAVTPIDLNRLLLEYEPDVVHFSGHGTALRVEVPMGPSATREFNPAHESLPSEPPRGSAILLETHEGHALPVSVEALARLFGILKTQRCVVLNACFSAMQAAALAKHVDCVIGMKRAIDDKSALVFSAGFYQAIARGQTVKAAFDLACSLISTSGLPGADVPQLLGRVDPGTVQFVQSNAANAKSNQLRVSDVQIIPNNGVCTLDFRVWNSGNSTVLINRVIMQALEIHALGGGMRAYLPCSAQYDLDIAPLARPGDVISCNVSQVLSSQEVDRFGIRIGAELSEGEFRRLRLRTSLLTNLGRVEGPDVTVYLPDDSHEKVLEQLAARYIRWKNTIPSCLNQYRNELQAFNAPLEPIWEILERAYPDPIRRFQVLSDWLGSPINPSDHHTSLPGRLVSKFPQSLLVDLYVRAEPLKQRLRISVGGIEIVNTTRAFVLHEKGREPLHYVPQEDVRAELHHTDLGGRCKFKGDWHYLHVIAGGKTVKFGAIVYPEHRRDHVIFLPQDMDSFEIG